MPVEASLTPRQLRTIADRVEALTKARIDNQAMGVPATPDVFDCRFPSGHRGTVTWTEAPLTSARARERNSGKPVHRYVVELHAPDPDDPGETGDQVTVQLHVGDNAQQAIAASLNKAEAQRRHLMGNAAG
jgi:hypothetical protein